jgi:Telomere resolvase ResT/TelK catalytic domain
MAYQWLTKRWPDLFSALEQAETEEAIKQICEAEIQAWRDERPGLKSEYSLSRPLTDTCTEIKKRMSGIQRQFALQYMTFSTEKWSDLNDGTRARLEQRLEHQKLLMEPDKIVAVATELLSSEEWPELVVGLAATTGRRLIELLQVGQFEVRTTYSVTFSGQAKRKDDDELPLYEIPTLCPSSLVLDAFNRLRLLLDTTGLEKREVSQRYGPAAREAARAHFGTLIPAREGKADIINHTFRTVYSRIAVRYYCPPTIADVHFMATIQGHYDKLQESDEKRRSYESNPYYQEYKIGSSDNNIDGRQGLHLGHKGVELLEVFKPKPRKEKAMTTPTQQAQSEKKRGNNRPVNIPVDLFNRYDALHVRLGHKRQDETMALLLDSYEEKETAQIAVTLTLEVILGDELAALARSSMEEGESVQDFLKRAVTRMTNFQAGLKKRYSGTDFTKMSNAELMKQKDKEASFERVRRAISAIALFNDTTEVDERRWFINVRVTQLVCGARFDNVSEYFKLHKPEIDALNAKHQLTQKSNSKTYDIKSVEAITQAYEAPVESAPAGEPEPVAAEEK